LGSLFCQGIVAILDSSFFPGLFNPPGRTYRDRDYHRSISIDFSPGKLWANYDDFFSGFFLWGIEIGKN
jgi:hypothetical protein